MVPRPSRHLLVALDPDTLVAGQALGLLLGRNASQVVGESRPDEQDVAVLELGALVLCDGLEVLDGDCVGLEGGVLDALGARVLLVVEEDAAADHAAPFVPVVQRRQGALRVEGAEGLDETVHAGLGAVVVRPRGLVGVMDQAVPLRGALRVELDFVVEAVDRHVGVFERERFVHEAFTIEPGRRNGPNGPVQGHRDAVAGFLVGLLHYVGSQEVDAAQMVLFAVLVEQTPGAMCYAVDRGEAVEVREVLVVCHGRLPGFDGLSFEVRSLTDWECEV